MFFLFLSLNRIPEYCRDIIGHPVYLFYSSVVCGDLTQSVSSEVRQSVVTSRPQPRGPYVHLDLGDVWEPWGRDSETFTLGIPPPTRHPTVTVTTTASEMLLGPGSSRSSWISRVQGNKIGISWRFEMENNRFVVGLSSCSDSWYRGSRSGYRALLMLCRVLCVSDSLAEGDQCGSY